MKKAFLILLFMSMLVSCGPKAYKTYPPPPSKEEQLRKADEAFRELEVEAEKPAKDLTLEEKKAPVSKYPLVSGLPVWVSNPNYGGVLGGVGIAKKIQGKGYAEQKRLAKQIALADLAKQIEVVVETELTKIEINIDTETLQYYKKRFSSLSKQEVRSMLIKNAVIEDEWVDPKTGDLYVWVVIK